jgi:hypothetical protein
MNYNSEIRVSEEDANHFNKLCSSPNENIPKNFVLFDEEVKFQNNFVGCVQVISPENIENETSWCQFILYEPIVDKARGTTFLQEVCFSKVGENFLGEYTLDFNGDKYILHVLIEDGVEV